MFSFEDELKWYEPGLETLESALSGDQQKDLVEIVQQILKSRMNRNAERLSEYREAEKESESEPDENQLIIDFSEGMKA